MLAKVSSLERNEGGLDELLTHMDRMSINDDPSTFVGTANNGAPIQTNVFTIGDIVQVSNDLESVQSLQNGHGEWTEAMIPVSISCLTNPIVIAVNMCILFSMWKLTGVPKRPVSGPLLFNVDPMSCHMLLNTLSFVIGM